MSDHINLLTVAEQCEHLQLWNALRNARNTLNAWQFTNSMALQAGKPAVYSSGAVAGQIKEVDGILAQMVALEDKAEDAFRALIESAPSV